MSYDGATNRRTLSLHFPSVDFGTGADVTKVIQLPTVPTRDSGQTQKFNGAHVVGAMISNVTEDFVGTTTGAGVRVGEVNEFIGDVQEFDLGSERRSQRRGYIAAAGMGAMKGSSAIVEVEEILRKGREGRGRHQNCCQGGLEERCAGESVPIH